MAVNLNGGGVTANIETAASSYNDAETSKNNDETNAFTSLLQGNVGNAASDLGDGAHQEISKAADIEHGVAGIGKGLFNDALAPFKKIAAAFHSKVNAMETKVDDGISSVASDTEHGLNDALHPLQTAEQGVSTFTNHVQNGLSKLENLV